MTKTASRKRTNNEALSDGTAIDRAVATAVKKAVDMHRRAGNKVAVLRRGRVLKIDPKKIPI